MEKEKKRSYWFHRINHYYDISKPMLENGYLIYGFVDFAVKKDYLNNATNLKKIEEIMENEWGCKHKNRFQLERFLLHMRVGDYVLVPTPGAFTVCEVLEDNAITIGDISEDITNTSGKIEERDEFRFITRGGCRIDLGFARRVKILAKDISRREYADSHLTSRMKARQTNLNISDLEGSILKALESKKYNKPISFMGGLTDAISVINDKILSELSPDKFEELIKWYFNRVGASIVEIPSKNASNKLDKEDVDVIATFDSLRTIFYVQAKHHEGSTGDWAVKQIEGVKNRECISDEYKRIYWVLSSASDFTDDCIAKAMDAGVQLINGRAFAEMLLEVGLAGVDKAFK